ncbi:MAG: HEPN domain-containing protein [Anaerolineae bacterium]|nr:HEPN domain-containing protein [Anaerolineae bacterium]MDW8103327.1 HEPN domain-containing protein [Anaerolineae bacterium]
MERSADWLDQAQGDIALAKSAMGGGFYDWACFAAQQAAEKAVKAVFQKLRKEAWGHAVAALLEELSKEIFVPPDLYEKALELDKAYIPTRYPNAHPWGAPRRLYTKAEAQRLIGYAEQILSFCENILPSL